MVKSYLPLVSSIFCFYYCLVFLDYLLITSIGISFTLYIFLDFIDKIGVVFPVKEFLVLIAALQWIVGAKISYTFGKVHYKYYMYVDEPMYMNYVVPGLIFMSLGLHLFKTDLSIDKLRKSILFGNIILKNAALTIVVIGLVATILGRFLNFGGIAFILYLSSVLMYVGVAYLFFLYPHRKWFIFTLTIGSVFLLSISSGLFHELLLIGSFLTFLLISKETKFLSKFIIIVSGFIVIYTIQLVKKDLRSEVWSGESSKSASAIFFSLVEDELFSTPKKKLIINKEGNAEEQESVEVNNRLNQGWIISKVLSNVPKNEPFLNGETVLEAISSSILPRFLFPDKKGANQALINFQRITGLHLQSGTSMGLSIIGEFYANFGVKGGWVAMFFYGCFLSLVIRWLVNGVGKDSPVILFWFILFFYQVVKAETDLIKIINHLFKSLILFFVLRSILLSFKIDILPRINK